MKGTVIQINGQIYFQAINGNLTLISNRQRIGNTINQSFTIPDDNNDHFITLTSGNLGDEITFAPPSAANVNSTVIITVTYDPLPTTTVVLRLDGLYNNSTVQTRVLNVKGNYLIRCIEFQGNYYWLIN